ncbi:TraR/DksA family transcriptional regulator [Rhizobium halophilum]|uniref:TraR/DksA family transcriptional regulator n=1 Tax=Rhizobium halophilum TaxID=2846852 RepID=UPI001EFEAEB5|nr:TraR/DksA family transcriptional regulator [Rhizobium halophilum]MCF6370406.1 TraR/DksA family transcriptional regulator [Rhizobium halophilum]
MDAAKHENILKARKHELEVRLHKIEEDFEQPRNPDDDDRATERNNDEVLEELGETGQRELHAIDAALDRIGAGTFGICVRCGGPIGDDRLGVVPHTPFCKTCAAAL